MTFSAEQYLKALNFAARVHGEQKTPFGFPYVVHLAGVSMELIRALEVETDRNSDLAISCALLHDVIEDTQTTREELEKEFGTKIADGVQALTKNAALPKSEQMADSLRRIRAQAREIAMVKLADRITNLAPPPPHWSAEKVAGYRAEAEVILKALGGSSAALSLRFNERLAAYPR